MRGHAPRHLLAADAAPEPGALKDLAAWYREYAERTDNPAIWHARLATAEELEREAARLQYRNDRNRCMVQRWATTSGENGDEPAA